MEYLTFGPFLWHSRIHFLNRLMNCRRVLILGDGDGRFTACLLRANPALRVHAIDASFRMIESLARLAAPHRDRFTTEVADIRGWRPVSSAVTGDPYDLVVSHFFLDCLTTDEVRELARRVNPALTANARWLVSEFAIPRNIFGRAIAAPLVACLYRAFGLLTGLPIRFLPDYAPVLSSAGWIIEAEAPHLGGLLVSQLWRRI